MKRRHTFAGQAGIAAAILALGAAAAPTPAPADTGLRSVTPVSKEYVDPKKAVKEKKKKARIGGGNGKEPWQWDKKGNARDSVGNYRAAHRLRRRILTSLVGVPNSGRQWRMLQKRMRVLAPDLLTAHPLTLLRFAGRRV